MDVEVVSKMIEGIQSWDFKLSNGNLSFIEGDEQLYQRSVIAAYLQKGTVPQYPDSGNAIAETLLGDVTPSELNQQMVGNIRTMTGTVRYVPKYTNSSDGVNIAIKGV